MKLGPLKKFCSIAWKLDSHRLVAISQFRTYFYSSPGAQLFEASLSASETVESRRMPVSEAPNANANGSCALFDQNWHSFLWIAHTVNLMSNSNMNHLRSEKYYNILSYDLNFAYSFPFAFNFSRWIWRNFSLQISHCDFLISLMESSPEK